MTGYRIANLDDLLDVVGEDDAKSIFADYSCPSNSDIEDFLKHKAIEFSKQGLAKTQLVFASHQGQIVLVGYFALAYKTFYIRRTGAISAGLRKRIKKFARVISETNCYEISAPLIAQLGKNYNNDYNKLITGNELLKIACDKVAEGQSLFGGKVVYVECVDNHSLLSFYERNGFREFDRYPIDRKDRHMLRGEYMVQMLKYRSE